MHYLVCGWSLGPDGLVHNETGGLHVKSEMFMKDGVHPSLEGAFGA